MVVYGSLLAVVEYTSNLTISFLFDDYTRYGLRVIKYPSLDTGAQTLCLVFMSLSIRTQWRYQDVLKESRQINATKMEKVTKTILKILSVDKDAKCNQIRQGWRSAARL
ncbi:uncharacterized protein PHALS_05073 [Plasmopara halstedii]|uniref:Uncharacterized protein n=1 Tax=Plasmopara halstedii TaxID=4781 RepID=A0A0P1ABC2_PLAHL|nr:uncharacterized protein PHALS_05073 [Plasmopara halstedii]CEG37482.1 hypothetical protein PHALS_05073 [Plasmopara halstedii]|eukprot:XP_024573851.1 hypothetical protein PHALS_05073 [Plasmopara halstedii]